MYTQLYLALLYKLIKLIFIGYVIKIAIGLIRSVQ